MHEPTDVDDLGVLVTAGGRIDLLVEPPARVDTGGGTAVVVARPAPTWRPTPEPTDRVDLLSLRQPGADLSFDPEQPDRRFTYEIGRRIAFIDGQPGFWWTINGRLFPDVPMFHVEEGDVVRMTIQNDSGDVHPMHLHGHHAIVLSRDGVAATGSPWCGRLAQRRGRRDLRDRLPRRQPGHLDGPLPPPRPRAEGSSRTWPTTA